MQSSRIEQREMNNGDRRGTTAAPQELSWDIFCRVIDNFGDAAVCWRLAEQLHSEHGGRVRLWIDRLEALNALHAAVGIDTDLQRVDGIEVRLWNDRDFGGGHRTDVGAGAEVADIVIEAFGCGLPASYVERMAERLPRPLWITLEYLSAESWVASHHGLPSPHPSLDVDHYFFFPGYGPAAGGLLREKFLPGRRDEFQSDPAMAKAFWSGLGFVAPDKSGITVSLFGYENPAVDGLLQAWSAGTRPVTVAVTDSRIRPGVEKWLGLSAMRNGETVRHGAMEMRFLPFLSQRDYDELLWSCDWNFVRGEDSFVRAQWAARPLLWHIYPQSENVHAVKLEAFLDLYCAGLDPQLSAPLRLLWRHWNGLAGGDGPAEISADSGAIWARLSSPSAAKALMRHAGDWSKELLLERDLTGKLVDFCQEKRSKA